MVTVCCSLPKKLRDYLERLSEECEDTRSEIMRLMVQAFYDHEEWENEIFPEEEAKEGD